MESSSGQAIQSIWATEEFRCEDLVDNASYTLPDFRNWSRWSLDREEQRRRLGDTKERYRIVSPQKKIFQFGTRQLQKVFAIFQVKLFPDCPECATTCGGPDHMIFHCSMFMEKKTLRSTLNEDIQACIRSSNQE